MAVLQLPKTKELFLWHAAMKSPHERPRPSSTLVQGEPRLWQCPGAGLVFHGSSRGAPSSSLPPAHSRSTGRAGQGRGSRQLQKAGMETAQAPCSTSWSDFQALPPDTATKENQKTHWVQPKAKHPKSPQHCSEHLNMHSGNTKHVVPREHKYLGLYFKYQINYPSRFQHCCLESGNTS